MLFISNQKDLKNCLSEESLKSSKLSLVPTMGNLHEGHLKLVEQAGKVSKFVCVSIFVNPLQFGPEEDFSSYPRTLSEDLSKLEKTNCSLVFAPKIDDMTLEIRKQKADPFLSSILCGRTRQNHFDGVVTIVNKLFELFQPKITFFGEKDYQQLMIIKEFVERKKLKIAVEGVPTERELSGLAKSSRNNYLSRDEIKKAAFIHKTLINLGQLIRDFNGIDTVIKQATEFLEEKDFNVDYLEARDRYTLQESSNPNNIILLCAATLNKVRLIDNLKL
jgi:pantoate--beta-alanine ligase